LLHFLLVFGKNLFDFAQLLWLNYCCISSNWGGEGSAVFVFVLKVVFCTVLFSFGKTLTRLSTRIGALGGEPDISPLEKTLKKA
jgi:hypothetical protein